MPAVAQDRLALRHIVQQQCLLGWQTRKDPAPCASLSVPRGADDPSGYALLQDRKGGAHFLLIPTLNIPGIESQLLLQSGAFNYFAAAWRARRLLDHGEAPARDRVGLAVNAPASRGQDQLHIHIECLGQGLLDALRQQTDLDGQWRAMRVMGLPYEARTLHEFDLRSNPFRMLSAHLGGAHPMSEYTLVLAGTADGFVLLAGRGVPGGEHLLDSRCPAPPP